MNKTRVVIVVPKGLDGKGGIERLFQYMAGRQIEGIDVRFLTSRGGGSAAQGLLTYARCLARLTGLLILRRVDILHVNLSVIGSVYRKSIIIALGRIFGTRIAVHYHGGGFDTMYDMDIVWVRLTGTLLRQAHAVIALGQKWRRIFEKMGVPEHRIAVIYNGVPDFAADVVREFRPDGPLRICFAGEVGRRKGVDVLVESLVLLKDEDWTCVIAGNGDIDPFRQVLVRHGLERRVVFTGWVDSATIHAAMREADIVVLPSRDEALPVALIEGAAAGAALVASAAGSSEEIVRDGEGGIIVPVEAQALADALRLLARDRAKLLSMQRAARANYLALFRDEIMQAELLDLYRKMMEGRFD